jgi:hypothetical protein
MVDTTMSTSPDFGTSFRIGDVFNRALAIFRYRLLAFVALTALAHIPYYLLTFALKPQPPHTQTIDPRSSALLFLGAMLQLLCYSTAHGAAIYGVVQELRGQTFSIAESLQVGFRRFFPLVGVALSTSILIVLAALLLVFPAFIVYCMFIVAVPVCIVERQGVFGSLRRSAFLTKRHRWKIFGMLLVLFLLSLFVGALGALFVLPASQSNSAGFGLTDILTAAVQIVIYAFSAVLIGVLYYQLRVAKEGVDIDRIASVFD